MTTESDLRGLMATLVERPPGSRVDVDSAIRRGERRRRARRLAIMGASTMAVLLAAASFLALAHARPVDTTVVTDTAPAVPDQVSVHCDADGAIHLSIPEVSTQPAGVVLVVTSDMANHRYFNYLSQSTEPGSGGGGRPVRATPTRLTLTTPPAALDLSCSGNLGRKEGPTTTLQVTDPNGYWRGTTQDRAPECASSMSSNDWIASLFQHDDTADKAVDDVLHAFEATGVDGVTRLTATAADIGYVGAATQTWIASQSGRPYVTILVTRTADGFDAYPDDRCQ